jgi:hypothetical protein
VTDHGSKEKCWCMGLRFIRADRAFCKRLEISNLMLLDDTAWRCIPGEPLRLQIGASCDATRLSKRFTIQSKAPSSGGRGLSEGYFADI